MKFVYRLAASFHMQSGKTAYLLAFGLGAILTTAFPPFWLLPALAFSFAGWVWLLEGAASRKQAFWLGWWFGFGHFTTGLYWITIALGIDGGAFLWVVPFAMLLLPGYLALFPALAGMGFYLVPQRGMARICLLSVFWVVGEYLRSHLFTGFPWNLTGYVWTLHDTTLQTASLVGVYGLSAWAVLLGGSFSLLDKSEIMQKRRNGVVVMLVVSIGLTIWGFIRLPAPMEAEHGKQVRIVQANIAQSLKWDPKHEYEGLRQHLLLSRQPSPNGTEPDYIIWPETAMPYPFESGSGWARQLGGYAPRNGALLTGVERLRQYDAASGQEPNVQIWNSIKVVDDVGRVVGHYDKHKLVPFGEFLPFRTVFEQLGLQKVTHGSVDFSAGEGADTIRLPGDQRIQPLICYEGIFPGFITTERPRPDWLLNITNDAWFGHSIGPYQHFHMARMRAVETGVPMVRAANSGISGVIDGYGRVQAQLGLGMQGVIDATLPASTAALPIYLDHPYLILLLLSLIFVMANWHKTRLN